MDMNEDEINQSKNISWIEMKQAKSILLTYNIYSSVEYHVRD